MNYLVQQGAFLIRKKYIPNCFWIIRSTYFKIFGMKIGKGTKLPRVFITWPHQISIGQHCNLEHHIQFKYDGIWSNGPSIKIGNNVFIGSSCEFNIRKNITIGNDSLVASGCKFIDHDHGFELDKPMRVQKGNEAGISIGNNVWLGVNVVVLKGVQISDGAIVAAGAVVLKSVPSNEIWGGIPARKIGTRE